MMNTPQTPQLHKHIVSGSFYYSTEYYHPNNAFTMDDYLTNHLPEDAEIIHIDGSYAEILYEDKDYGVHAGGNGDSFNHHIRFELL